MPSDHSADVFFSLASWSLSEPPVCGPAELCRGSAMSSFSENASHTNDGRSPSSDGHDDDAIRQARPVSLIFKRELLKRVPLSFPTIWKMMREGRFPRARIIGGKSAWLESEIDQFLTDLPVRP